MERTWTESVDQPGAGQMLTRGWFRVAEPGTTRATPSKEFMLAMARHGFEPGAAWAPAIRCTTRWRCADVRPASKRTGSNRSALAVAASVVAVQLVWYVRLVGFFDFRCPITRLSLRASDAVHIAVVAVTPERWAPLSLPIRSRYNRLGSIDAIPPDGSTAQFVDGFARIVKAGRVVAPSAPGEFAAFIRAPELEALLNLFARENTDSIGQTSSFTLDGRPMRQMLIQADAFEALAPEVPTRAPGYEALEQQLRDAPIDPLAREMFEAVIIGDDDLRLRASVALTRVAALDAWLAAQGRTWTPGDEARQSDNSIDLEFALAARRDLAAHPALVRVIDDVIAELEREAEEDRAHQRWRDRILGRS